MVTKRNIIRVPRNGPTQNRTKAGWRRVAIPPILQSNPDLRCLRRLSLVLTLMPTSLELLHHELIRGKVLIAEIVFYLLHDRGLLFWRQLRRRRCNQERE